MNAELTALATSGATRLVELMATELWIQARGRFAALFGRTRAADVAGELDVVRDEVLAGGDADVAAAEWAPRLRRLLAADEDVQAELRALLAEFGPAAAEPGSVQNTISGGTFHGTVLQSGSIGDLTINPGS